MNKISSFSIILGQFAFVFGLFLLISCNPNAVESCPKLVGVPVIGDFRLEKVGAPRPDILSIEFLDSLNGFGLDNFGQSIHKTTDGGKNWTKIPSPNSGFFVRLDILSKDSFFVQFSDINPKGFQVPRLVFTADGGQSFENITTGLAGYWSDFHFFDRNNGFCFASVQDTLPPYYAQNYFMKTTDGGKNWVNADTTNRNAFFYEMEWLDQKTGFLLSFNSIISRTFDGGQTWEEINLDFQPSLGRFFWSENDSFLYTANVFVPNSGQPLIPKFSKDLGKTWQTLAMPSIGATILTISEGKNGMFFSRSRDCDDPGAFAFFSTNDGGFSWEESLPLQNFPFIERIPCRQKGVRFALANSSQLLKITKK
jgi:photosystem II stability/assembly factor-like uncharacterized protein